MSVLTVQKQMTVLIHTRAHTDIYIYICIQFLPEKEEEKKSPLTHTTTQASFYPHKEYMPV